MIVRVKSCFENERFLCIKNKTSDFLSGNIYPALVALFVLTGHVTALEFYFNIPIIISVCISLFICPNMKPFLIALTTFLYQIPFKHTPADFNYPSVPDSTYYARPFILAGIITLGVLVLISVLYRFIRYSLPNINRKTPMILPCTLISLAFILNGLFSNGYTVANLFYALAQVTVYFFLFYLIYFGIKDIKRDELISYISYIALLNAAVIIGELAFVYLTYENLIVDGVLIKEAINLGWAVSNPIGFLLTSFIPMIFLGAIRGKRPLLWLLATLATYFGALATLSRNAMLFSTLTLLVCLIYGCFRSENKRLFRITVIACGAVAIILAIVFSSKITALLGKLFEMGLNDNGRFELWERAVKYFLAYPIFGVGFFGFGDIGTSTYIAILPTMPHNTILILLSQMGIFGLVAFVYYRVKLLLPLAKGRTHEKNFLLISFLVIIATGMLDNFVFYIYTMFYYVILKSAAVVITDGETPPSGESETMATLNGSGEQSYACDEEGKNAN